MSKQVWVSGAVDAHAPPIAARRSGALVNASPRFEATSKNAVMWLIEMRLSRPSNEALLSSGTAASWAVMSAAAAATPLIARRSLTVFRY